MELNSKQVLRIVKSKWAIVTGAFFLLLLFTGEARLIVRYQQWRKIRALKEEIKEYNETFERDKAALERLKHDPDAVVEVARERYYMKTDDEDIFIVQDSENEK